MSQSTIRTSGSPAVDRELTDLRRRIDMLGTAAGPLPIAQGIVQHITTVDPSQTVRSLTAAYTQDLGDFWLLVDATAGAVVISLLSAGAATHMLGVKKIDASGNAVTVTALSPELIDGAATKVLAAQYESYIFVPDGTSSWNIF